MREGKVVVYGKRHYEWLRMAGRWPSRHIPRVALRGVVVREKDDGTVVVRWPTGDSMVTHFVDSLEVCGD